MSKSSDTDDGTFAVLAEVSPQGSVHCDSSAHKGRSNTLRDGLRNLESPFGRNLNMTSESTELRKRDEVFTTNLLTNLV